MSKILVIGEHCIDKFIYGAVSRLNPEAPTPILNPIRTEVNEGMAANVAANLLNFGNDVIGVYNQNKEPIIKTRYVDDASGYILFRVDENDKAEPITQQQKVAITKLIEQDEVDGVIISDYNKGFLSEDDIAEILDVSRYEDALVFLDSKKILGEWANYADIIKVNRKEYDNNIKASDYLNERTDALIVTLGAQGARWQDVIYSSEKPVITRNVAGAGDTFLAAFATHYINTDLGAMDINTDFSMLDNLIIDSIKQANYYASLAVSQAGVCQKF